MYYCVLDKDETDIINKIKYSEENYSKSRMHFLIDQTD